MPSSPLVREMVLLIWHIFVLHDFNISHSQHPQPVACRISLSAAAYPPDPGVGQYSSCPPQSTDGIHYSLFETNTKASASLREHSSFVYTSSTVTQEDEKGYKYWPCELMYDGRKIYIFALHFAQSLLFSAVKALLLSLSVKLPVRTECKCKSSSLL